VFSSTGGELMNIPSAGGLDNFRFFHIKQGLPEIFLTKTSYLITKPPKNKFKKIPKIGG